MADEEDIPKAPSSADYLGRYREIVADPVNLLIARNKWSGFVRDNRIVLHNGHRVPVGGPGAYYDQFSHILVINRGVHEPLEEFVFQEMLKVMPEAPTMIELGAYWAHYSMWMMQARPKARTIMVEPEAENLQAGAANFRHHGYEGEFIQSFVGKGKWELDLFAAMRGLAHIDVLHVDIQGYEIELIPSAAGALASHAISYLFVSTHSQATHTSIAATLKGHGYRIEAESDFIHSTSFDGLIFAVSPKAKRVFRNLEPYSRPRLALMTPEQRTAHLNKMRAAIANR